MASFTVDGRSVFAARSGSADAAAPAVVFIHGAGMSHSAWAASRRALAQRGRGVLAIDLPGHGRSAGPPLDRIAALADWLVRLLDAAEIAEAGLAGHSLGALVALDAAARYGRRVRALALVGAALAMPVHPKLLAAARDDLPAAVAMIGKWGKGTEAASEASALPDRSVRLLQRAAPGVLAAGLEACDAWRQGAERAAAVRCPAVVIAGEADRMTPLAGSRALAAAIPGAVLEIISGGGHMLPVTDPAATVVALERVV